MRKLIFIVLVFCLGGCKGRPLLSSGKKEPGPEKKITEEKPKPEMDAGPNKDAKFVIDVKGRNCEELKGRKMDRRRWHHPHDSVYKEYFSRSDKVFFGQLVHGKSILSINEKGECTLIFGAYLTFKVEIPILNTYKGESVKVEFKKSAVGAFVTEKERKNCNGEIGDTMGLYDGFKKGDKGIVFVKRYESTYRFTGVPYNFHSCPGWWKIGSDGKIIDESWVIGARGDDFMCVIKELFDIKEGLK